MNVRKAMAGGLIRLAHRIYRPAVTVEPFRFDGDTAKAAELIERTWSGRRAERMASRWD